MLIYLTNLAGLRLIVSSDRAADKKYVRCVIRQLNSNKAEPKTLIKFIFYFKFSELLCFIAGQSRGE